MAEDSQTVPFPPDGIGLYSKNSAVSQLPCESGGIRTNSHASRTATSGSGLPGIWT